MDGISYELLRVRAGYSSEATVYLVRHPRASTTLRVIHFPEPRRLDHWVCGERPPRGDGGGLLRARPVPPARRGPDRWPCDHSPADRRTMGAQARLRARRRRGAQIAARGDLPDDPAGDLVQAGPLLVSGGESLIDRQDREGFSAGSSQFDSDITVGRYPRCALGITQTELLAVCCDGRRSGVDGGLAMDELARLMMSFGTEEAINLDGGGSATLVHCKHLLNRPYTDQDQPAPESRPVVTAFLFEPTAV